MRHNRAMKTQPDKSNLKLQSATPQFPGLCLLSACLILAGTGCKNEAGGNANIDPTGVYALVSVDGMSHWPFQSAPQALTEPSALSATL